MPQPRQPQLLDIVAVLNSAGQPLTDLERAEAEGLVNLAEFLTLLRLRASACSTNAEGDCNSLRTARQ